MSLIVYRLSNLYMTTGTAVVAYGLLTGDLRFMLGGIVLLWFGAKIVLDHIDNLRTDGLHVD
jgi:hypothetical protein